MLAESLVGTAVTHLWDNWDDVLTGATLLSLAGHLVNTFPTPKNQYGQWFLGGIQYIVGQRIAAKNTMQGENTMAVSIPRAIKGTGDGVITVEAPDKVKGD